MQTHVLFNTYYSFTATMCLRERALMLRYTYIARLFSEYFDSPLLASIHQCSVIIHSSNTDTI